MCIYIYIYEAVRLPAGQALYKRPGVAAQALAGALDERGIDAAGVPPYAYVSLSLSLSQAAQRV